MNQDKNEKREEIYYWCLEQDGWERYLEWCRQQENSSHE